MAFFPFNGVKNSFYGDLHATGKDGVRFFTENKVEVSRWLSEPGTTEAVRRPMETGA
jgi:malonate-semialdehyde dehydrogenase (acetylating)/methylmalonate-semialdehyde dehydrogenase